MVNMLEDVTVTEVVAHLGKLVARSNVKCTKMCTNKKKGIGRPINYLHLKLHRNLRAYIFEWCIIGDIKLQPESWSKHIVIGNIFRTDCFGTRR
jgi:hypothetical protein